MSKNLRLIAAALTVGLIASFFVRQLAAAPIDHTAALKPFVNDDTFAVAYVDVGSLNAANLGELFAVLPKPPDEAQAEMLGFAAVSGWLKSFQDAGGQGLYAVLGLSDMYMDGGPLVIVTMRPGNHSDDLEQLIHTTIRQPTGKGPLVVRKGDVLLFGTKATVARYSALKASARNDLLKPIAKLSGEGAATALVFCPGPDFRRIVRELWPELPGPLAPLRGELADRWLYLEAAINLPPNPRPRIALQAKDAEAAAIFVKLFRDVPSAVDAFKVFGDHRRELKQTLEAIVEAIPPHQDGARVTMRLAADEHQLAKLRRLLTGAADMTMESSRRRERMDKFKNLTLAMLNYESAKKYYPPAAIYDKNGRPLLSWRVAILPYLDQGELFKQFHLDEPWDSPHNQALINKMPEVYADPDPKLTPLAREGKTTYQVPVGPQTVFHDKEGTKISDIKDGTSKTILLVEVEPLRAVIWTKPEDWEVDMTHPRRGVERVDRKYFVCAFCDGSAHAIQTDIDEKTLRALLTRAGGEVVSQY